MVSFFLLWYFFCVFPGVFMFELLLYLLVVLEWAFCFAFGAFGCFFVFFCWCLILGFLFVVAWFIGVLGSLV